jgi:hypothetical protein
VVLCSLYEESVVDVRGENQRIKGAPQEEGGWGRAPQ